jgi:hypothetical protein
VCIFVNELPGEPWGCVRLFYFYTHFCLVAPKCFLCGSQSVAFLALECVIVDSFERGRKPTFTRPTLERTHDDPEGGPTEEKPFFV